MVRYTTPTIPFLLATSNRSRVTVALALAIGGGTTAFAPLPAKQRLSLGIAFSAIVLWVGTPVPPWFTGLLTMGAIGVCFSTTAALGGLDEPVVWLVAFGLVISEALQRSTLVTAVERELQRLVVTEQAAGTTPQAEPVGCPVRSYRRLLVALSFGGLLLGLVIPSSLVRVLLLAPLLVTVGDLFDSADARRGLVLGPLFATYYGGVGVLTAFLPNVVVAGIAESLTGVSLTWSGWFASVFPVMGLGRTLLVVGVVYLLYRPDEDTTMMLSSSPLDHETGQAGDLRRTLGILIVGVLVWSTDFVHGLHPVFGALVVTALLLARSGGPVSFDVVDDVDFSIVFFLGAVFAIADTLETTGVTEVAATHLLSLVPPDAPLPVALLAVAGLSMAAAFLVESVATASVLTPVLVTFATNAGLPVAPVVKMEAIALGHVFVPYQSAVLVTMLEYDPVEPRTLVRVATVLSLATLCLLVPLQVLVFWLL